MHPAKARQAAVNWGKELFGREMRVYKSNAPVAALNASEMPTLATIRKYRGIDMAEALIARALAKVARAHGSYDPDNGKGWDNDDLNELAGDVFTEFYYWNVAELRAALDYCKKQKSFGLLKPAEVLEWFQQYNDKRKYVTKGVREHQTSNNRYRETRHSRTAETSKMQIEQAKQQFSRAEKQAKG